LYFFQFLHGIVQAPDGLPGASDRPLKGYIPVSTLLSFAVLERLFPVNGIKVANYDDYLHLRFNLNGIKTLNLKGILIKIQTNPLI